MQLQQSGLRYSCFSITLFTCSVRRLCEYPFLDYYNLVDSLRNFAISSQIVQFVSEVLV